MLISERGDPSSFKTRRLKSSPIVSETLLKDSKRELAVTASFFSPPPLLSTDGIVNVIFGNYLTTAAILATSAAMTSGFVSTSIIDSVVLRPFPVT